MLTNAEHHEHLSYESHDLYYSFHRTGTHFRKVLKSNKPEFINIYLNPNQKIIPKLSFGDPIEDLSPRLNRNEFYENMIIDPLIFLLVKRLLNIF